jgi:hypothetical protein
MPEAVQRFFIRIFLKVTVGSYSNYGLPEPDHKLFEHHPTINSELLNYIKLGKIKPHSDIKRFDGKMVEFTDGTKEEIDIIVYATGYRMEFPMIPAGSNIAVSFIL